MNFVVMKDEKYPAAAFRMIFYTSCLSPFSLRKGLNIRVNLGPRISKKGCFFFKFFRYFRKKG